MNKGVEMVMKLGVLTTRLGARLGGEEARAELRGFSGILNLEFRGPEGGGWHLRFDEGQMRMARGLARDPRATVRLTPEDYLAMLAGDLSPSVARMTGRVRVVGDGNLALVFGASVGSLRALQAKPGLRGRIGRAIVRRALRKGNYTPGAHA